MSRTDATHSLAAVACVALLACGAVNPLIGLICLAAGIALSVTGTRIPFWLYTALHTLLVIPFVYLALLRDPPVDLLSLLLTFAAPLLLLRSFGPRSDFNEFLIFLVSLLLVVGSAAVAPGWMPLLITALYVMVAGHALAALTRRAADPGSGVRIRLLGRTRSGWWNAAPALAVHHLALSGLLLGGVLYLVIPRPNTEYEVERDEGRFADATRKTGRSGSSAVRTGFPKDVKIGDIGRIKRKPFLVLRLDLTLKRRYYDPGPEQQTMLLLRARAWQSYSPRHRSWRRLGAGRYKLGPNAVLERGDAPLDWKFEVLGYDGRTLFLPQRARKLRSAVPLFRDRAGVITADSQVPDYGVEGAMPLTPNDLRGLEPDRGDPRLVAVPPTLINSLRRHLPAHRRGDIAAAVAAIEGHFADGFRYTLDLPAALPSDRDPIVAFLERKEGHCELYASAACLFLRLMGVPARLAGGLRCSEKLAQGRYQARFSNAHAWVEIPCRSVGFVAVDFTPADNRAVTPIGGSAGDGEEADPFGPGAGGGDGLDWSDPFRYGPDEQERVVAWIEQRVLSAPVLGALGLAVLSLALWAAFVASRRRARSPLRVSAPRGLSRKTLAFYARWLRECAGRGHVRRHAQTPREFLRGLPADLHEAGHTITREFERKRYGSIA